MADAVISAIVPTKGRPEDLAVMLRSLLAQSVPVDEIIVVDQSSDDVSRKKAEETLAGHPQVRLQYILDQKIRGAAQARNRGIEQATGDVIFFFDDDVILKRDYIRETMKVFADVPGVAGVGGVITNNRYLNDVRIKFYKRIFQHGIFKDQRGEIFGNYEKFTKPVRTRKLSGGCCAYKREVFNEELFDERFDWIFGGYAMGEDIDLSLRISRQHPLVITTFARMEHKPGEKVKDRKENQVFLEAAGWTYMFAKTFRGSMTAWLCYIWVCCGWLVRSLKNLLMLDTSITKSVIRGIRKGYALSRERVQ